MSAITGALISVALGYFFYLLRAALCCPPEALPFPISPLCLAPSVHPRGTLEHSDKVVGGFAGSQGKKHFHRLSKLLHATLQDLT